MSQPTIEAIGLTDVGQVREHNEDAWSVFRFDGEGRAGGSARGSPKRIACVVADGMGGHSAGEVASARAVEIIERELRARPAADPIDNLRQALEEANRVIWQEALAEPAKAGMGTTAVCAVVDVPDGQSAAAVRVANVGDSPAYVVSNGETRQITRDHSWVAEQVARGFLSPEEAVEHPYRHILTRALGTEQTVQVETYEPLELQPGDSLLLCSDGLTEHVRSDEIASVVAEAGGIDAAARALVDLANQRGGLDNITVVVVRPSSKPSARRRARPSSQPSAISCQETG